MTGDPPISFDALVAKKREREERIKRLAAAELILSEVAQAMRQTNTATDEAAEVLRTITDRICKAIENEGPTRYAPLARDRFKGFWTD